MGIKAQLYDLPSSIGTFGNLSILRLSRVHIDINVLNTCLFDLSLKKFELADVKISGELQPSFDRECGLEYLRLIGVNFSNSDFTECSQLLSRMKCLVYLYIYDTNIAVNNLPEDCEFPQLRYLSMEQNETRYPIGFSHMIARCPALSNLDTSYSYPDARIEKRWFMKTRNRLHMFECDVNINDAEELYNVKNVLADHLFDMKL